jgi:CRISPR/Cas system CSM-associated protein Csm3 (group 7 of RAMP superfamily)
MQTTTRSHNSIDKGLRKAAEDHLFTVETGWPVGACFAGTIRPRPGHTLSDLDRLLVLAALRLITEVGGKRRRGLGSCRFELDESDRALLETSRDFLSLFTSGVTP